MRAHRTVAVAGLLTLVAACGSEGVALEDWVADVDEICGDVDREVDDLQIRSTSDALDRGEEAIDIREEGLDDVEALERPDGEDGEVADGLLDALQTLVDIQHALIDALGDGDDELGFFLSALEHGDEVDEIIDAAEAADSNDCLDGFEERNDRLEPLAELADALGPLADTRVGDCVANLDDELEPIECDDPDAEGEVVSTNLDTGGACAGEGLPHDVSGVDFCVEEFGPGPEEDGLLELGSCVLLVGRVADESVDVTEFSCDDPAATHEITEEVGAGDACLRRQRRFAKTGEEVADSGRGSWCATRL